MNNQLNNRLPALYLDKLENPRRVGRQLQCTCPVCGTRHLYVDPQKGLFKCFYAGCTYKGIAEEKKTKRHRFESSDDRYQPRHRMQRASQPNDGCDYTDGCDER